MIFLSHPTCNENVRNAALALAEAGILSELDTCFAWNQSWSLNKFIPIFIRRELERRALPQKVLSLTKVFPSMEMARHLASRLGLSYLTRHEYGPLCIDAIYKNLDRKVSTRLRSSSLLKAVYSYEDGALETFRRAHELGIKCVYDLPIGYWRAFREIYQEESELEPEWAPTLECFRDSESKLARKDEELRLADTILVMSEFTKSTLKLAKGVNAPIKIVPLGAPAIFKKVFSGNSNLNKKVKIIYVGSLTQRKGLSYLIKAMSIIGENRAELTLVGRKPSVNCRPLEKALNTYRWMPSLSHVEIIKLMRSQDVLVLPSLFEGFGLVILEAMSQGLPVITTPNTCGPDIIEDGVDGFIVPIRSAKDIAGKIEKLLDKELLVEMSAQAADKADLYSWDRYRRAIVDVARSV